VADEADLGQRVLQRRRAPLVVLRGDLDGVERGLAPPEGARGARAPPAEAQGLDVPEPPPVARARGLQGLEARQPGLALLDDGLRDGVAPLAAGSRYAGRKVSLEGGFVHRWDARAGRQDGAGFVHRWDARAGR
jgi:hypothetical protein